VFAEDEARLLVSAARTPAELDAMVQRRASGLPLEHVLGWAEFCGLRIAVDPGVFVPRRRSEFLARQAIALARGITAAGSQPASPDPPSGSPTRPASPDHDRCEFAAHLTAPNSHRSLVVVELCCGAGAVSAALAAALDRPEVHAVDIDPAAVRCARRNLTAAGGRVYPGDLYAPLPAALRGRVDVLVANAPYVPTGEIGLQPAEARLHEPRVALDGGADGLDVLRRVIGGAPPWLAPEGGVLVETSERQAPRAAEAMTGAGLAPRVASSDEMGATVVIGTRPDQAR
jgi:release factor glutamine methyltransferase